MQKRELIPSESEEQEGYFLRCRYMEGRFPALGLLVHIPNEGRRTAANGARLKCEGMKAGYPDIALNYPRGGFGGMFIEMKRRGGGRKTPEQKTWIRQLNEAGNAAAFCYGMEEAWEFTHAYLTCENSGKSRGILERYIRRSMEE